MRGLRGPRGTFASFFVREGELFLAAWCSSTDRQRLLRAGDAGFFAVDGGGPFVKQPWLLELGSGSS